MRTRLPAIVLALAATPALAYIRPASQSPITAAKDIAQKRISSPTIDVIAPTVNSSHITKLVWNHSILPENFPEVMFFVHVVECAPAWKSPHAGDYTTCAILQLNSAGNSRPSSAYTGLVGDMYDTNARHGGNFGDDLKWVGLILKNTTNVVAAFPHDAYTSLYQDRKQCADNLTLDEYVDARLSKPCTYHDSVAQMQCWMTNVAKAAYWGHAANVALRATVNQSGCVMTNGQGRECAPHACGHNQVHLDYTFRDVIGFIHDDTEAMRNLTHKLDVALQYLKGDDYDAQNHPHVCLSYDSLNDGTDVNALKTQYCRTMVSSGSSSGDGGGSGSSGRSISHSGHASVTLMSYEGIPPRTDPQAVLRPDAIHALEEVRRGRHTPEGSPRSTSL